MGVAMLSMFRIGELAAAAGVSTDAVRYYERLKILHVQAVHEPATAYTPKKM